MLRGVVWTASALLVIATLQRYAVRRPPYFAAPRTVFQHVDVRQHPLHGVLVLLPQVEPLIPRGSDVTVFHPKNGETQNDHDTYLTAVGLLPHHNVLPPFTAGPDVPPEQLIEWVVAVGEPFTHPRYAPVAGFPNGWLYRVRR
jgi:hypothetical protein